MWVCSLVGSMIADRLRTSGRLTTTNTRKLFNSIGKKIQGKNLTDLFDGPFLAFLGPAVTLVMLIFAGCNHVAVITLLCLTVGLNGFNYSGVNCNHIDVAPNFAGTLMGISNTAANVMGFLTPMVISPIVEATVGKIFLDNEKLCYFILFSSRRISITEEYQTLVRP